MPNYLFELSYFISCLGEDTSFFVSFIAQHILNAIYFWAVDLKCFFPKCWFSSRGEISFKR